MAIIHSDLCSFEVVLQMRDCLLRLLFNGLVGVPRDAVLGKCHVVLHLLPQVLDRPVALIHDFLQSLHLHLQRALLVRAELLLPLHPIQLVYYLGSVVRLKIDKEVSDSLDIQIV